MEFDLTSAIIISTIVLFYIYREFNILSKSDFKNKEAKKSFKNNSNAKYSTIQLNSITNQQSIILLKSKKNNNKKLIIQSKPFGIGWL